MKRVTLSLLALMFAGSPLLAKETPAAQDAVLKQVRFDQNLDAQVPLDIPFRDETGRAVRLKDYFGDKPVILSLVYFECPMLCTETLNGLVRALRSLHLNPGEQFNIVTVSFDARETPALAAAKKKTYVERYGRKGAENAWTFLTGSENSIRRLADSVGFHYVYDSELQQFAHPAGLVVLTPQGRVSRYLYGVEFSAKDLRLSLIDASSGKIGSIVDQVLFYCYHYDPFSGTYSLRILHVLRLAGLLVLLVLGSLIGGALLREKLKQRTS